MIDPVSGMEVVSVDLEGGSILNQTELSSFILPLIGQRVVLADLEALANDLSQAYVAKGYLNSGVVVGAVVGIMVGLI